MKKSLISILALLLVLSMSIVCFATSYTSYLSISTNSYYNASARSYVGSTHQFDATLSSVVSWETSHNKVSTTLVKKVWGDDTSMKTSILSFPNVGDSDSMTTSGCKNGNYYYRFITERIDTNAFKCNTVTMSSY